jgi:hypothetical protein
MRRILFTAAALAIALPFIFGAGTTAQSQGSRKLIYRISGTVAIDPVDQSVLRHQAAPAGVIPPTTGSAGCSDHSATNVRTNQECTNQSAPGYYGRGESQNETSVAVNPTNPDNIIISQNDYRRGDATCGVNFSLDGGETWGSELAPTNFARGFLGGARHYWTSGGDTSVGFDSTGEAYLMCQVFDRPFPTNDLGDDAAFGPSGFVILRSADGGASWSFPADYVVTTGGAVRGGLGLLDKEYMTIDNNPDSPYADRIYVAWANYPADFSIAPIYFAYSDDHGVSWHQTGGINGHSDTLCPLPTSSSSTPGDCDNSQFANPFVAPNGDVYVAFINGNNCSGVFRREGCPGPRGDNHFQILIVKSTDGGSSFSGPVKVGNYFEVPACYIYTHEAASFGRGCVPTAPISPRSVFRVANYPSGVALDDDTIVVDYASYLNRHSRQVNAVGNGHCVAQGLDFNTFLPLYDGVGVVNGCNNDIVRSVSVDGGASFTGGTTDVRNLPSVNDENPGGQLADQWFQWTAKTPTGGIVTSYYDRKYDSDMRSGNMDFTLASGLDVIDHVRVTDVSSPPSNEFPGVKGFSTFMGDYTGLAVGSDGIAHPAWEDTRNPLYTFDLSGDARQLIFAGYGGDIYTASVPAG